MGLTKTQQVIWEKSRAAGSGDQAVGLSDGMSSYLLATIVRDLSLENEFPNLCDNLSGFFPSTSLWNIVLPETSPLPIYEKLLSLRADADMYFACLAALYKARLKYELILQTQPIPTLEQIGPRSLLQYGKLSPRSLAGLLFWRKWLFDIDNRAAQETGYLFEPVIASAIGGTPVPARKSPIKRSRDPRKGRQVDCLLGKKAYEFKIRVTIAASGQGRWREELEFPVDCRASGYKPVLVVLDATPNPKLEELSAAFERQKGDVFAGDSAWRHLESKAGATMGRFLEKYVHQPIEHVIAEASDALPEFTARMESGGISLVVGGEALSIDRSAPSEPVEEAPPLPDDVADETP